MMQPAPMTVLPRRMVPARMTAPGAMTTSGAICTVRLSMITPFAMWLQQNDLAGGLGGIQLAHALHSAQQKKQNFPYDRSPFRQSGARREDR